MNLTLELMNLMLELNKDALRFSCGSETRRNLRNTHELNAGI